METHLTYLKMTDRSSELTREAQRARRAQPGRSTAAEVATSTVAAGPFALVRLLFTGGAASTGKRGVKVRGSAVTVTVISSHSCATVCPGERAWLPGVISTRPRRALGLNR
jgi:hypothetical protein